MSDSFFTSQTDAVLDEGSANFSTKISASASTFGLSTAQAASYAVVHDAWHGAYLAAITPSTRTKSSVAAKNAARTPLRHMASALAKIIAGTPVSNSQKIDLGISVRAAPMPMPAPGTPDRFAVSLAGSGALTLTWKCANPPGSSGTMYQVWRRIGATGADGTAGALEFLGGSGEKKFVDDTLPAGSGQVMYQVRAIRSTAVGASAQYNVNLGVREAAGSGRLAA